MRPSVREQLAQLSDAALADTARHVADRLKVRARCYALRVRWVDAVDAQLEATRAKLGQVTEDRDAERARYDTWRRELAREFGIPGWITDGEVLRRLVAIREQCERSEAAVDRAAAAEDELAAIRDELRSTGHAAEHPRGGLSYAVDAAIDRERIRRDDAVALIAAELPMSPTGVHRYDERVVAAAVGMLRSQRDAAIAICDARSKLDELAVKRVCSCREAWPGMPVTSRLDPRCPTHSPGYRFGGRPVAPLALPPIDPDGPRAMLRIDRGTHPRGARMAASTGPSACGDRCPRLTFAVGGQAWCTRPPGHDGWHRDGSGTEWGPMCQADLDGATCAEIVGHEGPCRPLVHVEGVPVARCAAVPAPGHDVRCSFVAGHPGLHSWSPELDEVPF